jgi:disulfide bond formation protein DsbB
MISTRTSFILGFLLCAAAIGVALYFQHVVGLEPCPLCVFQRISVMLLGVIFLLAVLHNPGAIGTRIYGLLITLASLLGIGIAGRHLWLQYGPHEELGCGPTLDYMMEVMPLDEVVGSVFEGTGDCGEILWSLFGISIPGWTLLFFLAVLAFGLKKLFGRVSR